MYENLDDGDDHLMNVQTIQLTFILSFHSFSCLKIIVSFTLRIALVFAVPPPEMRLPADHFDDNFC